MNDAEGDPLNELTGTRTAEPRLEYTHRAQLRRAEAARQMQRFRRVGILRLASLRRGVVQRSNALELMRSVGLEF